MSVDNSYSNAKTVFGTALGKCYALMHNKELNTRDPGLGEECEELLATFEYYRKTSNVSDDQYTIAMFCESLQIHCDYESGREEQKWIKNYDPNNLPDTRYSFE